jgi:hypothetical protein
MFTMQSAILQHHIMSHDHDCLKGSMCMLSFSHVFRACSRSPQRSTSVACTSQDVSVCLLRAYIIPEKKIFHCLRCKRSFCKWPRPAANQARQGFSHPDGQQLTLRTQKLPIFTADASLIVLQVRLTTLCIVHVPSCKYWCHLASAIH